MEMEMEFLTLNETAFSGRNSISVNTELSVSPWLGYYVAQSSTQ